MPVLIWYSHNNATAPLPISGKHCSYIHKYLGPISHPVVKSVVKCMVITRLSKWFGIELHCVSTDRVSDLAAIEWLRSQRLTTGYLVVMGGHQRHNKRS